MLSFGTVVIGCGAMGSAALYHLSRRGENVLGIDRFVPPHHHGSTHGASRVVRRAYFEHASYIPLMNRSYELWEQIQRESQRTLFHRVGVVTGGHAESVVVRETERAARSGGVPLDVLSRQEALGRWPQIIWPADNDIVLLEPDAGFALPEETVDAHMHLAAARGARFLQGEVRKAERLSTGAVRLDTDAGSIEAQRLILTPGPWAAEVLDSLNLRQTLPRPVLERNIQVWFPGSSEFGAAQGFPTFIIDDEEGFYYGIPAHGLGFKVSRHGSGQFVNRAEDREAPVTEKELESVIEFVRKRLPRVDADHVLASVPCLYSLTPDSHFVVDCLTAASDGIHGAYAYGFSGHGFKFAPVIGEILADLALEGATTQSISFLSPARFVR